MNEEHERIEELLAGYALLGLSGEDAIEADRLLSEHVPSCPLCRETMAGFQAVAGELALAPTPVEPPELLLPRIRRSIADVPVRRGRSASLVAVAASVAALLALGGLSLSLGSRVSRAEAQRGKLLGLMQALQRPGANHVSLQPQGTASPGMQGSASPMMEVSGPSLEHMYVVGQDVPQPAPGNEYRLWLGSGGTFQAVEGGTFLPEDGLVVLELTVDPSRYDEILITEEPAGSNPSTPSTGGHVWHAGL